LIAVLANTASTLNVGTLVGQAAGGGVAGTILTAIFALIKNKMVRSKVSISAMSAV